VSTSPAPDPGHTGERRRSRERALELGYESEAKSLTLAQLVAELPVAPEEYGQQLVIGLGERLDEVDALIAKFSSGWAIDRMPAVDRWILRISTYELLATDVPFAVVIDEAVELAKEYSTEDSGRFVNGVLAAVADEVR
jgi:N utilization substance protein B